MHLLTDLEEQRYCRNSDELSLELNTGDYNLVIIDDVQKAPKLLDTIHKEIEERKNIQFILKQKPQVITSKLSIPF